MAARVADDGSLLFPKRGKPPREIAGYQRDRGDPFILRPIYPECPFRGISKVKLRCGKIIESFSCKKGFHVSFQECKDCITSGRRDE